MTDEQSVDPLAEVRRQIDKKRRLNARKAVVLESMGGLDMNDVKAARFGFFSEYLVKIGVLTDEQMETFNLEWEEHLENQLALVETKTREALHHAQQQEAARARQLLVPGTPGLIVPGNGGGASRSERRRRS